MKNDIIKFILKKNIASFLGIGFLLLINSVLSIATSVVLMKIIDEVLPKNNLSILAVVILVYIIVCLLQVIFSYICNLANLSFLMKTENNMKELIINKIFDKSGEFLAKNETGELYQVVVGDTVQLCDFVINNLFSCLYVIFSFVTSSLYLVVLDWKIFLVIIVLQPISLIVQMIISPVITRYSKESREVVSKYIQSVQEMFMNPVGLLLSGMRKQIENRVLYRQKESYKASKKIFV